MIIGRITKDTTDIRRATVDFAANGWLDTGEAISAITTPTVALEQIATWQSIRFVQTPPLPADDTTPLSVSTAVILTGGQKVQLMMAAGTPGLTYKITFVATGSTSTRQKTIDLIVSVREPA